MTASGIVDRREAAAILGLTPNAVSERARLGKLTIAGHTASANGKPAAVYYRSEIEAWRDQRAAVQQRAAEKLRTQATMHSPGRQSDAATETRIAGIVERAVREHTLGPASPHLPASPTAPATNKRKSSPRPGP
jgi:hypothetical protein